MKHKKTIYYSVSLILFVLTINSSILLVRSQPTWNVEVGDTFDYKISGYYYSLNLETRENDIKRTFKGELGIEILEFGNFTRSGENGIKFNFTGYMKIDGEDLWTTGDEPATWYSDMLFKSIVYKTFISFPMLYYSFMGIILSQDTLDSFISGLDNFQDNIASMADYAENYTDNVEITKNETYDFGYEYEIMSDDGLFDAQKIVYTEDGVLEEYSDQGPLRYTKIKLQNSAIPGFSPLILGVAGIFGIFSLVYYVKRGNENDKNNK